MIPITIQRIKPSIVKIGVLQSPLAEGQHFRFFGFGSGFVVSDNGYIFTCHHVIKPFLPPNLNAVIVGFEKGEFKVYASPATIIHCDSEKDFAILKVEGEHLPYLTKGNFEGAEEGQEVLFSGFPLEVNKITTGKGIISAVGRDVIEGKPFKTFQLDASINNGNSGGPLMDINGNVIGIITYKYSEFDKKLKKILDLGKMSGISIGNEKNRLDIGETFYEILVLMRSHLNVGIGNAFSAEYAFEKLGEIISKKITEKTSP